TIAVIESNWLAPNAWPASQDKLMQVNGELGVLKIGHPDDSFCYSTNEEYKMPGLYGHYELHGQVQGPLMTELSHAMTCFRNREESQILPVKDALNVVLVADAIARSCREGR